MFGTDPSKITFDSKLSKITLPVSVRCLFLKKKLRNPIKYVPIYLLNVLCINSGLNCFSHVFKL